MMTVQCEECFMSYRVKPTLAGKRIRCKQCGSAIVVPLVAEELAPRHEPPSPAARKKPKRKRRNAGKQSSSKKLLLVLTGAILMIGLLAGVGFIAKDYVVEAIEQATVDNSREALIERFIVERGGLESQTDVNHASAPGLFITEFGQAKSLREFVEASRQPTEYNRGLRGDVMAKQGMQTNLETAMSMSVILEEFGEPDRIDDVSGGEDETDWVYGHLDVRVNQLQTQQFTRWDGDEVLFEN